MKNVALGDVATFVRGVTYKPTDVFDGGVGVARTKNVQKNLDLSDVVRIRGDLIKREVQYLRAGDILVSSANSWNMVGKACWVPALPEPMAIGGFVTALRPKVAQVDSRYLYRWFTSPTTQALLRSFSNQTTSIANLNLARASELTLPLPSINEQSRIAGILETADGIRSRRAHVRAHLDELEGAIFRKVFGPMTSSPRWDSRPLRDLAETQLGKMLDAKRQSGKNARPYLRNSNVRWFSFELEDLLTMDFDERDRVKFDLRSGDVLICEGGEPGRSAIWQEQVSDCYFQKALHRVRVGDEIVPQYLARAMRSIVAEGGLKDYVTSATIAHLTGEKLRSLPIPVPPMSLQMSFMERIEQIGYQRVRGERACVAENEMFSSLQQRAFEGEV